MSKSLKKLTNQSWNYRFLIETKGQKPKGFSSANSPNGNKLTSYDIFI